MSKVRRPAVAGQFYPGNKNELERELELLLEVAKEKKEFPSIAGLVAPHAGYIYSGRTAAKVYSLIKEKKYNTVIVISPSHYDYFLGSSIFLGDYYETPLGLIPLNKQLAEKIISNGENIFFSEKGHDKEHALEVHLPFLQKTLGEFNLVPIVMGDQSKSTIEDLSKALYESIDDSCLVVASSDMSHFYTKEIAGQLDSIVERHINNYDYEGLIEDLEMHTCEACGGGPIAAMMKALKLRGKNNAVVIDRSDSGDMSGDNSRVVGYLSAVVY